jgi:hypothetical protein
MNTPKLKSTVVRQNKIRAAVKIKPFGWWQPTALIIKGGNWGPQMAQISQIKALFRAKSDRLRGRQNCHQAVSSRISVSVKSVAKFI